MNEHATDTMALMRQYDFTKPIKVATIFDDNNVTTKGINAEHQDWPRLLDHPNINEQDMLRMVAKNICSIVEAYLNYSEKFNASDKEVAIRFRSIYFKTKYYFFQQSFPMSILLLRAQNRNDNFIRNFLKLVFENCTVRPDNIYDILGSIYNDLLQWTELKMEKRTFVTEQRHVPNKPQRLPYKSRTELRSDNLNDKEKNNNIDMLRKNTSYIPGSCAEVLSTNVEPNMLIPRETYIGNIVQDATRTQNLSQTISVQVVGFATDTVVNPSNTTEINSKINNLSNLLNVPIQTECNYSSEPFNLQLEHVTYDNQESVQNNSLQNTKSIQSDNRKSENRIQKDKMIPSISKDFLALISHDILYVNDPNKNDRRPGLCSVCGKETELICIACYNIYYCSGICQFADWDVHKSICG